MVFNVNLPPQKDSRSIKLGPSISVNMNGIPAFLLYPFPRYFGIPTLLAFCNKIASLSGFEQTYFLKLLIATSLSDDSLSMQM